MTGPAVGPSLIVTMWKNTANSGRAPQIKATSQSRIRENFPPKGAFTQVHPGWDTDVHAQAVFQVQYW